MSSFQVAGAWFSWESASLKKICVNQLERHTSTHLYHSVGRKATFRASGARTVSKFYDRSLETTEAHISIGREFCEIGCQTILTDRL